MFHTLSQLKTYCANAGLPLDQMRFALGVNKGHAPRWFYIYKDITGEWVVAKNKADGTTVERYRGFDEAAAVHIISSKMEEEANQRGLSIYQPTAASEVQLPMSDSGTEVADPIQEPWEKPRRQRRFHRELLSSRVLASTIIALAAVLIIACIFLMIWSATKGSRGWGFSNRPVYEDRVPGYSEPDDDNDDWFWLWWMLQNQNRDYGYDRPYDYDYTPPYSYDHDYGYDYDNGYDYDYDYDDGWDYSWDDDSNWDSWDNNDTDWDSGWDSWDSSGSDWDSDW